MTDSKPNKTTLKNGLRVLTTTHNDTKTAAVFVLVATGSKHETKEQSGISHFLEHMFFKGTKRRPTLLAVTEPIDRVGGEFNAFTSYDYTGYHIKVEYDDIGLALDIVSDIFFNSIFPEKEIVKEKGVVIQEINIYRDNPMRRAEDLWQELLYGDQPAGRLVTGTKETVSSLSREDLLSYMRSQYVSSHTVVSVAGRIDASTVTKKIATLFSTIKQNGFREKQNVVERQLKPGSLCGYKETDQTRLMLGVRGYNLFDKRRFAKDMLAMILGGMFSSRLFMEIRDHLGLAYDIRTGSQSDPDTGYLVSAAGVPHGKVEQTIRAILKEYKKLTLQKVSANELKKAQEHFKGTMALGLEASDAKASFFGMQELLERRVLTPEQIYAKMKEITPEYLRRVAQDLFVPSKLNLVAYGPFSAPKGRDLVAGGKEKKQFEKLLRL